jgi:hypothetical protein
MKDAYGFRALQKDKEWPKTRRAEVLFTWEESAMILLTSSNIREPKNMLVWITETSPLYIISHLFRDYDRD